MNANTIASSSDRVINLSGDEFSIFRNGTLVCKTKGFFCGNNYPNTIQFLSSANIETDDLIIHSISDKKYYAKSVRPLSMNNTILGWMVEYLTESEFNNKDSNNNSAFSIGTIYGSAIVGNNNMSTINNGYNLNEIKSLIKQKPIQDQEELNKLINRIEIITEDNQPISKGTLGKFSDLLAKHSDIAIALGSTLMKWLTGN